MKIEKLQVGNVYKNYKALCEELEIKPSSGNAKIKQFKEIEHYVTLEKDGYNFIVSELLNPVESFQTVKKIEKLNKNLVQLLLMDHLANSNGHLIVTTKKLAQDIGLINEKYRYNSMNKIEFAQNYDLDLRIVGDYFMRVNGSINDAIRKNLAVLKNSSLIVYNTVQMVKDISKQIHRKATIEETQKVLEINRRILDFYGFDNLQKASMSSKSEKVFNDIQSELYEIGIEFAYEAYEIIWDVKSMNTHKQKLKNFILEESEQLQNKFNLNYKFSSGLLENAKNRNETFDLENTIVKNEKYIEIYEIINKILIILKSHSNKVKIEQEPINVEKYLMF